MHMDRSALIAAVTLGAAVVGPLVAQPPPDVSRDDAQHFSYLNTSFEAQEALAKAEKRVEEGAWSAAAAAYHAAADRYGDYLIGSGDRAYESIGDYVSRRISGWPAEGLEAYREVFEGPAGEALKRAAAGSAIEPLLEIADQFFPTSAAATALDEAGERSIEAGDFASARRWYELLASVHPDRASRGARWRAKAALCAAWSGDLATLGAAIHRLSQQGRSEIVTWQGRRRPLSEALIEQREALLAAGEWRGFPPADPGVLGGGPDRRGLFPCGAEAEARLWRIAWSRADDDSDAAWARDALGSRQDAWLRALQSGRLLAIVPASDGRRMYVHDARSAWAIDPAAGDGPLWRFEHSPGDVQDYGSIIDEDPPPQFTSLVAGGKVFVHLEREQGESDGGSGTMRSSLVCLDAATGKLLWRNDLAELAAQFCEVRLDGAPVLENDGLFAVARRRKQFGFEACFLLRLDASTGALRWSAHVGEAATGSYGYHRPTRTHPAAAGDLVFVQSNLGTVAAVCARSGRVVWLRTYESKFEQSPESPWPSRPGRPIRSWNYPTTILWRDAMIAMPLDSDRLHLYHQLDGEELADISLEELGLPEALLGVAGDHLYLVGAQLACYDLAERRIVWQRPIELGQLCGRGAVTTGGVLVPTDRALLRYPLDGGAAVVFPWTVQEAGNVLPLPDQIVVASAGWLTGLTGRSTAFALLERRMEASPRDPMAALALAQLAFQTGEDQRGLVAVDDAVKRGGGLARLHEEGLRRRFFEHLMSFAAMVAEPTGVGSGAAPEKRNARLDTALKLLNLAGQCAPDAEGQLSCRLRLARIQLLAGQPGAAVATYQRILDDPSLRAMKIRPAPEVSPPGHHAGEDISPAMEAQHSEDALITAAHLVAGWIDRLIRKYGADVYRTVERRAEERLRLARRTGDAAALLRIAEVYPNSSASVEALAEHGRWMVRDRRYREAETSYRRAIRHRDGPSRPDLIRELADCLILAERLREAREWLERGAREYPAHQFRHDGRAVGFAEYARAALGERPGPDDAHPTILWPLRPAFTRLYPDRAVVLDPMFTISPGRAWDALIVHSGGHLESRQPMTGRAVWPKPLACRNQPLFIGTVGDRHVFATAHRIFAVARTSGQTAWQIGSDPPDNPADDPESFVSWTCHLLTPRRLLSISDRGEVMCIVTQDGGIAWRATADAQVQEHLAAGGGFVCVVNWRGRRHVITVLDEATGEIRRQIETDTDSPLQAMSFAPDGSLIVVFSGSIVAVDPAEGTIRWRAATAERFVPGTLRCDLDGAMISPDGRRIVKYELASGRPLWATESIGSASGDGLWMESSRGIVYAACGAALAAFDAFDGRVIWSTRSPLGVRAEPPRLCGDSLVTIAAEKGRPGGEAGKANGDEAGRRLTIRRYRLGDGVEQPVADDGPIVTEPLESYGGLSLRDGAAVILDGNQLIGYGQLADPPSRAPARRTGGR